MNLFYDILSKPITIEDFKGDTLNAFDPLKKSPILSTTKNMISQEVPKEPRFSKSIMQPIFPIEVKKDPIPNPLAKKIALMVRKLHEEIGCGLMTAKKALIEAELDYEEAIKLIKSGKYDLIRM